MSRLYRLYSGWLARYPLLTQMVSAGVIGSGGDAFCQLVVERKDLRTYEVMRGVRFFVLPSLYIAPILSVWFRFLERVGGNPKLIPLKKVLIDQLFFAPPFSASIIFNLRILEGYSVDEAWRKLQNDFLGIYKRSVQYWPCVQLLNFYFVPLNLRVIVVQLAAFFWNAFLSHKTQGGEVIPPLE